MEQPAGEDPTSAVEVGAKPAESIVGALWNEWPWSAQWCWRFTILQIMFAVIGHLCFEVGPLYKTVNVDEIELFTVARYVLIIPLIFITLLHLRERCRPRARHRALVISFVSMWEFSVKITYYTLLSEGYGLAFQNQRSFDYRSIYATRWMGWFFAIPTLLFMNLYPIMEDYPASAVVKRIFPQQACSAAYCWTCYLGCIIYDPWFGWFLNILGCVGYVVVIVDEAVLVAEHMLSTKQPILKGYSIIVKECIFVMYTCVWLMGCWSYTGSYAVQRFYTVSDVSLKATMSGLMFLYWNTEDYFGPAVKKDE